MDPTTLLTLVAAHLLEQYQLDLRLVPSLRNTTEKLLFREGCGGQREWKSYLDGKIGKQ